MEPELTSDSCTPSPASSPASTSSASDDNWKPVAVPWIPLQLPPGIKRGSYRGAGTLEMLDVVKTLNEAGITCCMVGVGALKYFGAWRHWEVCVPADKFETATRIFTTPPYSEQYERLPPQTINPRSLHHVFPLLRLKGNTTSFYLIPADDCHIDCVPANLEYSKMGLPYPKLEVLAQALLDTVDRVGITDLVDGMDLDSEWGETHLKLDGTLDVAWAEQKNARLKASEPPDMELFGIGTEEPCPVRPVWEEAVRNKKQRIGIELGPKELYATRFRGVDWGDPRLEDRYYV
ncbi:hypothetical protein DV735_g3528, partial [Chaetothyriales sp. CBS 134920]